jgi:hypothetical protein
MRQITALMLAGVLAPAAASGALAQDIPLKGTGTTSEGPSTMKDAGQAVKDQAGGGVECTPEQAAQDAALKEKTGVSTGCTPEKAAQGQVKKNLQPDTPGK